MNVFHHISKNTFEKRKYENTTRTVVFLTNFEMFGNVVKHCFDCFISLFNGIYYEWRKRRNKIVKISANKHQISEHRHSSDFEDDELFMVFSSSKWTWVRSVIINTSAYRDFQGVRLVPWNWRIDGAFPQNVAIWGFEFENWYTRNTSNACHNYFSLKEITCFDNEVPVLVVCLYFCHNTHNFFFIFFLYLCFCRSGVGS